MNAISYWDTLLKEEGEVYMWVSLGASALGTALFCVVFIEVMKWCFTRV